MALVLATGGLGFIGSHTCLSLLENDFDVLVVDSLLNSNLNTLSVLEKLIIEKNLKSKLIFKKGDIRDYKFLNRLFSKFLSEGNPIDSVIHFAGLKSVEESIIKPLLYWDSNINATLTLLKVMESFNCNKIVFSSSATIYKPNSSRKLDENSDLKPINSYGNSKLAIEKILYDLFYSKSEKWKIVCLRYFNPVGCHSSGLLGEDPKIKCSNIFPSLMKVIEKKEKVFTIHGNDWPTKDGTCVRDYIHVMDLAEAHLSALKYLNKNKSQIININVGTGIGTSVLELVNSFSEINKCSLEYKFGKRRSGDAPFVVADNSLALKILDWEPKRNLANMCSDTFRWIKNKKEVKDKTFQFVNKSN